MKAISPTKSWRSALYFSLAVVFLSLYGLLMVRAFHTQGSEIDKTGENTFQVRTSGYRDDIVFTVHKDPLGHYGELALLSSNESPLYAPGAAISGYLKRLQGIAPEEIEEVEGITGATVTVDAIEGALLEIEGSPFNRFPDMALFGLLWSAVLVASVLKAPRRMKRALLFLLSAVCFVFIAVLHNSPVTIYSLFNWMSFFHLLPFLSLASVLLYGNLYCSHICPFGFLQRAAGKIPVKNRIRLPRIVRSGKYVLLGVAAGSLLMGNQLYLEPYSYLFSRKAVPWLYILPIVILALAIWIPNVWCRGFCPLGAAMEVGRAIRLWGTRGIAPRIRIPQAVHPGSEKLTWWLILLVFALLLLSNSLLYVPITRLL